MSNKLPHSSSLFSNVVDPKLWADPTTITNAELQHYTSIDTQRMRGSYKNYRGSLLYMGGIVVVCLLTKSLVDKYLQDFIWGENKNGGRMLQMYTKNTIQDYTYNRQFQRMRWLSEEPAGNDTHTQTSEQLLVDLGVQVTPRGANHGIRKIIPHDKYLL